MQFWLLCAFLRSDAVAMSEERAPVLTATPAKRSNAAVLKARLILVFVLIGLTAFMGVVSTIAWATNKPIAPDISSLESQARAGAEEVAYAWLNGLPIPVGVSGNITTTSFSALAPVPQDSTPDAQVRNFPYSNLSWDSFERDSLVDGTTFEIHHFLVTAPFTDEAGLSTTTTYRLSVTMVLTDAEAVLGAAPSIEAYVSSNTSYKFDYSELPGKFEPSAEVQTVLTAWAAAYAANDSNQLALIVADPEKGVYSGIPGFTGGKLQVVHAINAGTEGEAVDKLIVRARVSLASANGFTSEAEYDLLVIGASTGSPHVVAWGPSGSANRADFLPYSFNRRPLK